MINNFDLKLGFRCNNNCKHCVVANKRDTDDMPLDEVLSIIDNVSTGSVIQITGGEPTMYSYLPEVLKRCKENNLYTIVQTNGTGFSDINFLQKCSLYLDHVHIAIHSCYPDIHDSIVQSKGMWEKTIQGLDNLIKENIFFTTQTVLSKYNIETLYDTFKFIQSKKKNTLMSMTYPHLNGNAWSNRYEIAFRYSDYRDVIQNVLKDFKENIFTEAIPFCYLHPYSIDVESLERDIISGSLSRIGIDKSDGDSCKDYNFLNLKEHRKAPLCKKCFYNDKCFGVWKEYIQLYKDNLDLYPVEVDN